MSQQWEFSPTFLASICHTMRLALAFLGWLVYCVAYTRLKESPPLTVKELVGTCISLRASDV